MEENLCLEKKWYGILLILEAILYLVSYGSSIVVNYSSQNLNGNTPLITTSSIFSIWNGMIICWVIWRIMKQRLNVEGLIAVLLLSITQLLMYFLPPFSLTNLMNISFVLNIICLIWICLLIKNVEMRELLNNWKSKDGWKSSIAYLVLFVASTNISPLFILIGMDRTSDIYAFTLRYSVMELMFLFLINVMITSTSEKLQKVFSLLLILSSLVEIGIVYSFISRISFYGLFYLLLSIYIVCRVFGLLEKVADSWESKVKVQDLSSIETKPEMADSQVEGEIDVNDQLNADIQLNNDKEKFAKKNYSSVVLVMERPYNSSLSSWYYDFSFIFRKPHVSTDLIYWCPPLYLFYDCDFHPFHSYEEWKCGSLKYISRLIYCFHHRYARSLLDRSKYFILGFRSPGIYWRYII